MAKNILVVDDAAFMRMMIKDILSKNGYNVAGEAENGAKAIEKYNEVKPDLVLMDIKMPVMNGFEALEKIKAIRPELIIIAQTAYSSSEDEDKIYKAGFYSYITKPIKRERLFEIIDDVFQKKNTNKQ